MYSEVFCTRTFTQLTSNTELPRKAVSMLRMRVQPLLKLLKTLVYEISDNFCFFSSPHSSYPILKLVYVFTFLWTHGFQQKKTIMSFFWVMSKHHFLNYESVLRSLMNKGRYSYIQMLLHFAFINVKHVKPMHLKTYCS